MHHPVRTHWPAQQAPQLQSGGIYLSRLKHQDTHQVVVHGTSQPHVHAIYCHRSNPECWACRTATIDPPTWLNEQGVGDSTGPHTRLPAVNCVVTVANGRRQAQSRMRRTVAEAAATRTAPRCIRCSRAGVPRLLAGATLSARCALNAIPKQVLACAAAASWYCCCCELVRWGSLARAYHDTKGVALVAIRSAWTATRRWTPGLVEEAAKHRTRQG
jgi:hypothetical protein